MKTGALALGAALAEDADEGSLFIIYSSSRILTKFRIFSSNSCSAISMRFFASTTNGSNF